MKRVSPMDENSLNANFSDPRLLLRAALILVRRGQRTAGRIRALQAVALAPDDPEAWQLLASLASPHAKEYYLARVRALRSAPQPASPAPLRAWLLAGLATLVILIGLGAWMFWPEEAALAGTLPGQGLDLGKELASVFSLASPTPSLTTTLTATLTPSAAATLTFTATLTASPTATPTATDTPTPSATFTATPTDTPTATRTPRPRPTRTPLPDVDLPADDQGKTIVVNIGEQHVYAFEDGELVFSFTASTGRGGLTRTGNYQILDKDPRAYSYIWGFWMPDWMGIYYAGYDAENGFHSLPEYENGSTLWGDQIGEPVTYGCVVLQPEDMHHLFEWAEIGTAVIIRQ